MRLGLRGVLFLPFVALAAVAATDEVDARIRVALLQMAPSGADVAENFAKAERFCRRAAAKRADIALMPEMWSTGFTAFDPQDPAARAAYLQKALATDSVPVQRFARLARELDMAIGVTYLQTFSPTPRNALTLFDRHGSEVLTYAKVHTSDFNPLEAATTPGDAFPVATLDTRAGPVVTGAMICFDREQPESARILMVQGAELVLTANASNLDPLRLDQFRLRAWENGMCLAMANYPRPRCNGRSVAYGPDGAEMVRAGRREGIYIAELDLVKLREYRRKTVLGNAYRRPHRYGLLADPARAPVWERRTPEGSA